MPELDDPAVTNDVCPLDVSTLKSGQQSAVKRTQQNLKNLQVYEIMYNDTLRLKPKPVEEDQKMILRGPVHKSNNWPCFNVLPI